MDFADFVRDLLPESYDSAKVGALQRIGRALDQAGGLEKLVDKNDVALHPFSPALLADLADAHRDYLEWKSAAKAIRREMTEAGLALPDGSLDNARTPHELRALWRAADICRRSGHADHGDWAQAIRAHLELFRAALGLALAEGHAAIAPAGSKKAGAGPYGTYLSPHAPIPSLLGRDWLSIRSGERAGVLKATLEIPWTAVERIAEERLSSLGLAVEKEGTGPLVDRFLKADLGAALLDTIDRLSERKVIAAARSAYLELLATPPLHAERVVAVYREGETGAFGAAVLDKKGDVVEHLEGESGDALEQALKELIARHSPVAAIAQESAWNTDCGARIEGAAAPLPVHRVSDASMAEARQKLSFGSLASSAVVLGRRALKPGREWGRIDPLGLDLGDYESVIDPEKLRTIFSEAKLISSWHRRHTKTPERRVPLKKSAKAAAAAAMRQRLNDGLRSLREVHPGMLLDGIVTNITRFGAFVNIGLPVEGMIHISQLSVEFVENPAQVVQVGQRIKVRVIDVVPEKERIALSLKQAAEPAAGENGSAAAAGPGQAPRRTQPKTRSAALADLDALFKK